MEEASAEQTCKKHGHQGGDAYADEAGHHETVVEQVFADDCSAAAVEIHRGDVGRIVGDKEITVDAGEYSEEHLARDSHGIGERKHRHHDGSLGVDEDGNGDNRMRDNWHFVLSFNLTNR